MSEWASEGFRASCSSLGRVVWAAEFLILFPGVSAKWRSFPFQTRRHHVCTCFLSVSLMHLVSHREHWGSPGKGSKITPYDVAGRAAAVSACLGKVFPHDSPAAGFCRPEFDRSIGKRNFEIQTLLSAFRMVALVPSLLPPLLSPTEKSYS